MWIIRFHLLQSKHYNKISRICRNYGFISRKISPLVFAKASVLHHTQKTSWRSLGRQFGVDHSLLCRFDLQAKQSAMLTEIFHVFQESKVALFIGNRKTIHIADIDNSQHICDLTTREFESIVSRI